MDSICRSQKESIKYHSISSAVFSFFEFAYPRLKSELEPRFHFPDHPVRYLPLPALTLSEYKGSTPKPRQLIHCPCSGGLARQLQDNSHVRAFSNYSIIPPPNLISALDATTFFRCVTRGRSVGRGQPITDQADGTVRIKLPISRLLADVRHETDTPHLPG